jgi:hypothetical protein
VEVELETERGTKSKPESGTESGIEIEMPQLSQSQLDAAD